MSDRSESQGRAGGTAGPHRVLIVDDDVHARRINSVALASEGFQVREARDGEEALAIVSDFRPDLIVMDIALPRRNGLEVTEQVKRMGPWQAPLVIVLSARAMKEDAEASRRAGCDAYLSKPIDPFDLVHEARRLLSAGRKTPDGRGR
ncbi:MAG TPA: response regulator [Candidatus Polarisedimenticolia bacterium]|nr:response regulator [Candidatus Polarisedimenticolia bacterium]